MGRQKGGCALLKRAVEQLENAKSFQVFAAAEHFCPKVEQSRAELAWVNLGWGSGPEQPGLPLIPCPWGGGQGPSVNPWGVWAAGKALWCEVKASQGEHGG